MQSMREVSTNEILDALNGFSAEMDQRFEKIDVRFEKIDQRFDQVDARFEKIDQRLDKVDARFDRIEAVMVTKDDLAIAIAGVRSEMVTKDYLDKKLRSLRVIPA